MVVDAHCHIFTRRIIENVKSKTAMVEELKLNVVDALERTEPQFLDKSAEDNGIDVCVLLPTATPEKAREENDAFYRLSENSKRLRSLATLHPMMRGLPDEIDRMYDLGVRGFKFSSFSQRFDVSSNEAQAMLGQIERLGQRRGLTSAVVFDTFTRADIHFGARSDYLTLPFKLWNSAQRHPGVNFIGAHMGGLMSDFDKLRREALPAPNLYLDTSNAAHTLEEGQFIELLKTHGSAHIVFGTDWPWFDHSAELAKIRDLMNRAGYDERAQAAVFGGNAKKLFGF